jgi:hypothetical protein
MDKTRNVIELRPRWTPRQKLRVGMVLGGFFVVPSVGAVVGTAIGVHQEHAANHHDAQLAQGYEKCLAFSQSMYALGKVTLKASEIPKQTQKDCQLEGPINDSKSVVKDAINSANIDIPLHSTIALSYDPDITLPTPSVIQSAIIHREQDSQTTGIGDPIATGALGFLSSLGVELAAAAAFGSYISHRNKPSDPDPQRRRAISEPARQSEAA